MTNTNPRADDDGPVSMTLRIVELIDCVAANAPDTDGRPISMITFAHLGELEQPMALSFEDTKLLVTKLLQSLSAHGNEYAEAILKRYFEGQPPDEDEGDAWKQPEGS